MKFTAFTFTGAAMLAATLVAAGTNGARAANLEHAARACSTILHVGKARCLTLLRSPKPHRGSWMAPSASSSSELAYGSEPVDDEVDVASVGKDGLAAVGQIALEENSFPVGMTVDGSGNLYVAISALLGPPAVPSVEVFPQGATQPSRTYTTGLSAPFDVAVDRKGTLFVADDVQESAGCAQAPGQNIIDEYAGGSMKPTARIIDIVGCIGGIALDHHGNLYASYYYYPVSGTVVSDVREYAPGSAKGKELNLQVPNGPLLGGLAFDGKDDLLVENTQADGTLFQILTYPKGQTSPSNTLQYGSLDAWDPVHFALHGAQVFAPAFVSLNFRSVLAEIDYPSGKERSVLSPAAFPPSVVFGFAVTQ